MRGENSDSIPIDLIHDILSRLPCKVSGKVSLHVEAMGSMLHLPYFTRKNGYETVHVICNPSTGQRARLPKLRTDRGSKSFLGFDPVDKQFKVLYVAYNNDHRIVTLGNGKMGWRKTQCPSNHHPSTKKGICIDGVLYYMAAPIDRTYVLVIVCFDVKSEIYKFIRAPDSFDRATMIGYKGKLGWIRWDTSNVYDGIRTPELHMWVLEDADKQEWSRYFFTFPNDKFVDGVYVAGMTATGDIVLSMSFTRYPFYVFYFNPERNTLQNIEIQGFTNHGMVHAFVDHVEDLNAC
ncbi:hypothetical protein EUTSA_v10009304mg [Eutrema salsugineum]|uniref:F-box associated beta-propeller type 3 domain-containing protein n=1 Tax=Eutrema salsugineum TaxID=72664 RepID=V4L1E1_EUTSA|nr:hypothetical protein EUTSA_v10009304mg [Eutrema salsugineum]